MATDFSAIFGSNETAGIEGVAVPLGGGTEITVARLGNVKAQEAYRALPEVTRRMIEEGLMEDEEAVEFLSKFMVDHLLKGWKGFNDDGKPLPFSHKNASRMLKKHRRFRNRIWDLASDEKIFNVPESERAAGNSQQPSSGT